MIWAVIDRKIDMLITDMLYITHAEVAAIVTGLMVGRKAEMLQRLITVSHPGDEWHLKMTALLSDITGNLAEERNRLIHDSYRFDVDEITRIDARARTEKVPFKGKVLAFDKNHKVTIEDLKKWTAQGYNTVTDLDELRPALLPWLLKKRGEPRHSPDTQ